MFRRIITENMDLMLMVMAAFFVCTKLVMINSFPGKHKMALFVTSLGFRSQAKLRNVSSKRKQIYLRRSNKLNLIVYSTALLLLVFYFLMQSL